MSSSAPTRVDVTGTTIKRGSAWISAKASERASAQQVLAADPKYKKYSQQVVKCLVAFDNVHEWADCTAFLKQLLKTLQSYPQFKEIPSKAIVSKRLSQCLNPALPSGVHQRVLEVYAHIFSVVQADGLKRDLQLWSTGLFPFFAYASTSLKPTVLSLYEMSYLPLQDGLRAVMKSFILSLLPGLEEEGEFFDRVLAVLDKLSGTVSPSFFLQNMWLVMLTSPASRGTAINFLSRRLPKLNPEEDITPIVGRDLGLMIRAFSAALDDDNLLVRRGILDLLVSSLRINSIAVLNSSQEDRAILMRASIGVVLSRDLSLNRRLYAWLLGSEGSGPDERDKDKEGAKKQEDFFRAHALDLLASTLREEMFTVSSDYADSRPFKVFISLLDKWEIGGPLTDILIYDTLRAIKQSIQSGSDSGEDVLMTASTLYEAVEPRTIWKTLFRAVSLEVLEGFNTGEGIDMARFILATFRAQEEEVQLVHLPIVFLGLLDLIMTLIRLKPTHTCGPATRAVLELLSDILQHIPPAALTQKPANGERTPFLAACSFYSFSIEIANDLYPIPPTNGERASDGSEASEGTGDDEDHGDAETEHSDDDGASVLFVSAFEALTELSSLLAKGLIPGDESSSTLSRETPREAFVQVLTLLGAMLVKAPRSPSRSSAYHVGWDSATWLSTVLASVGNETTTFVTMDHVISVAVALASSQQIEPRLNIDEHAVVFRMVAMILSYLRPQYASYHARAVSLIWALEHATQTHRRVESIIAQSLISPQSRNVEGAYEAFGVLWRLSEDFLLPGFRFKVPMMILLDTLKSDDPSLRRIGETWMRCSLKSYLRVLDPLIYDLLEPPLRWVPCVTALNGRELHTFVYERPFDQRRVIHILEILLTLVRFGGLGFGKVAGTTLIDTSPHEGLRKRVVASGVAQSGATYMDVIIEVLTRFVISEPKPSKAPVMEPYNCVIQMNTIDLLQSIVARGDTSHNIIGSLESAIIGKLYVSVHTHRLELQNKLLHLLHSVLSTAGGLDSRSSRSGKTPSGGDNRDGTSLNEKQKPSSASGVVPNQLLVQTLIDGVSIPQNRPLLQHWLDFVLMTIPQFQQYLNVALTPLNECICRQTQSALKDALQVTSATFVDDGDLLSSTTDADFIMLLNALERLVLLSLNTPIEVGQSEEEGNSEKPSAESVGLFGYVTNVFSSDGSASASEEQPINRSLNIRALHEAVSVLYSVWGSLAWTPPAVRRSTDDSTSLIFTRSRTRCMKVLERLFRAHSTEVFETIIDCWSREKPEDSSNRNAAFEIIDILTASAQNVVHMLCESISYRLPLTQGPRKLTLSPTLTDGILLAFLEEYLERLEGPLAVQVWGRCWSLVKDIILNVKEYRSQVLPLLRCVTVLGLKLTATTALEDRRVRRDLQEAFSKLLDACVLVSGRSPDQGSWVRRANKELDGERDSPMITNEVMDSSTTSLPELARAFTVSDLTDQVNQFIASSALPNARKFLVDNDKVVAICNNIAYYIVSPALKSKIRPLELDGTVMDILREMVTLTAALKVWRVPVSETLNDARFFNITPEGGARWMPVVKCMLEADKTVLPDLLSRVATASSANIFANKEYEMLSRSLNLRRVSYAILVGEKNQFLTQLPSIQEKLVDVIRNLTAPIVLSEVYLCMRVLLCRIGPNNLSNFWPVILTELYRVFEQTVSSPPSDGSEDLQLILAASKFLDLSLVLQTEEFQMHQWIFVTDTVDAVYHPDAWYPEALLDQLSTIVGDLPVTVTTTQSPDSWRLPNGENTPLTASRPTRQQTMRRPLLSNLRQIDSIRDLLPFFSHVSISTYESVYASSGNIAWDALEQGLLQDMFDG